MAPSDPTVSDLISMVSMYMTVVERALDVASDVRMDSFPVLKHEWLKMKEIVEKLQQLNQRLEEHFLKGYLLKDPEDPLIVDYSNVLVNECNPIVKNVQKAFKNTGVEMEREFKKLVEASMFELGAITM